MGSGSGGSAVAGRVSEVGEWEVVVLEAGGLPDPYTRVPAMQYAFMFPHSPHDYNYTTVPQKRALLNYLHSVRTISVMYFV